MEIRGRIRNATNYEPQVVNIRFVNPLDVERIQETVKDFDVVAVIEEAVQRGSIGEAVGYQMAMCGATSKLMHFCIKEETVQHGNVKKLREVLGLDEDSIYEAMDGVDYVFQAAALKQVPSCEFFPLEAVKTNVIGTDNVLSAAIECKVKKVICLSTDKAAYPINSMGMSKAMGER